AGRGHEARPRPARRRAAVYVDDLRARRDRRLRRAARVCRACTPAARLPDRRGARLRRRYALPHRVGLPARAPGDRRPAVDSETDAHAMRVMHVHRIRGIGGSERHLLTLLPALAERGIEPVFVGLDDPDWNANDFYEALQVPA